MKHSKADDTDEKLIESTNDLGYIPSQFSLLGGDYPLDPRRQSVQPDLRSLYSSLRQDIDARSVKLGIKAHGVLQEGTTEQFSDPRTDPASKDFDHTAFLKAVRKFAKAQNMEFSEMPIAFRDLTVIGDTLENTKIPTVGSTLLGVLQPAIQIYNFFKQTSDTMFKPKPIGEKEIIKNITGVIKPGELVLVIGRPGSGCSTLLRTLANQTRSFKEVRGEIMYSGFESKEIRDHYRGQIVYAQEDDPHFPSLTVRQTLEFALSCKVDSPVIRQRILEITLKIYGLVGCQNTVVGDSNLRGISGGEKKRVSLAEATVVGGCAGIFDGSLRSFADFQSRAVVASCYQASDAMFEMFDKVIVLADGECTYFGPTQNAVQYFQELGFPKHPRDTAAEYLTTCASSGKYSPEDLGRKFRLSPFGEATWRDAQYHLSPEVLLQNKKELTESYKARMKIIGSKHIKEGSPFATSTARQAMLLIIREMQIVRGNLAQVIIKYFVNILMAAIVGSVYLQVPVTPAGAYTRGGAIFFALLFNSVSAVSEIPKILEGRTILYKHMDMALYKPSTQFLAQYIFQMMLDALQVLLFSVVLYFMVGLQANAGRFFLFYFTLFLTQQSFGNFVRLFGFANSTRATAQNTSGVVLILFVIYSGYIIPHQYMKPWFIWVYWLNPLAYGFKTLITNEFEGLLFPCTGTNCDSNYQTCSMAGGSPGATSVDGLAYLSVALGIDTSFKWWNLLIIFAFFIFFFTINCIVLETVQHGSAGKSVKFFKPEEDKDKLNRRLEKLDKRDRKLVAPVVPASETSVEVNADELEVLGTLLWKDVMYTVPHPKEKGKHLTLLNGINGYAKPGTMTALMGSSGAGKTTLLDVIAMRKTIGKIEGKSGAQFKKTSGYCEQMDVHNTDATVREALRFAAFLRQPFSTPAKEKIGYVEKVIEMLEMTSIADALIGDLDSGIGISMEERKRLTIGVELVAKPKILFLDEPTSGLDAQAASNIIKLLKLLTQEGYALVVTIHQPSAMLFSEFDRLLLLGRGGKTIYFGDLGANCGTLLHYFERNGAPNYILESIGAGTGKTANTIDWFEKWNTSAEANQLISKKHTEELQKADHKILVMFQHTKKNYLCYDSNVPIVLEESNIQHWTCCVSDGGCSDYWATFFQSQNRVFAMFMTSVIGTMVINIVVSMFIDQRRVSIREQSSGTYGPIAFGVAITTVEIPFAILAATVFYVLFYWTVGLNPNSENAGYFYILYVVYNLWAVSFGQMVASAVPSQAIAAAVIPLMSSLLSLLSGVSVPYNSMPDFYRSWLYWIDPYHYFIEGLIVNDLHNLALQCDSYSFITVNIPAGYTCGQYFTVYSTFAPGALQDSSATGTCKWCPMVVGDTFFSRFSWDYGNRWRNLGFLFCFWIFNRICTAFFINRFQVKR
ncbi:hypothetical protein BCR33DRAFT_721688 [Rhizoclosmatium globosum]|uniref:ABC transporter domain-containing protein n=1 Tax=Rhizoclosmatium globosum TaxID=329046 RepID=A0A1Y2BQZ6_9FUNG|nr:hypothetical protein BCR33DRAFT_721688 [Rhizoclosmatium globosum]|eukprot:ORY37047.1 hypothetical protein BCR33DRAFT_721688 [Rhizoclosmatium globosum]